MYPNTHNKDKEGSQRISCNFNTIYRFINKLWAEIYDKNVLLISRTYTQPIESICHRQYQIRKNIVGKRYYEMYHRAFFSFYNSSYFIFLSTVLRRKKSLIPLQRDLIFHQCKSIDLNFHSARFKNC